MKKVIQSGVCILVSATLAFGLMSVSAFAAVGNAIGDDAKAEAVEGDAGLQGDNANTQDQSNPSLPSAAQEPEEGSGEADSPEGEGNSPNVRFVEMDLDAWYWAELSIGDYWCGSFTAPDAGTYRINVDGEIMVETDVYDNPDLLFPITFYVTSQTSYSFDFGWMSSGETYYFQVRAYDPGGLAVSVSSSDNGQNVSSDYYSYDFSSDYCVPEYVGYDVQLETVEGDDGLQDNGDETDDPEAEKDDPYIRFVEMSLDTGYWAELLIDDYWYGSFTAPDAGSYKFNVDGEIRAGLEAYDDPDLSFPVVMFETSEPSYSVDVGYIGSGETMYFEVHAHDPGSTTFSVSSDEQSTSSRSTHRDAASKK